MQTPSNAIATGDWDPHIYSASTANNQHYDALQTAVVDATRDLDVAMVLDLGIGTGETTRRLLQVHDNASCVGVDASRAMLAAAKTSLPPGRATFVWARLEDPLPAGPFDLVVSVLAVHHLDPPSKARLFARINEVLAPNGRFVLGDIVRDPRSIRSSESTAKRLRRSMHDRGIIGTAQTIGERVRGSWPRRGNSRQPSAVHQDHFDLLVDQLNWLTSAGLQTDVTWNQDLRVVITGDKRRECHNRRHDQHPREAQLPIID